MAAPDVTTGSSTPRPLWRKRRSAFPGRALAARGFTLVELLVAIAIMATMAFMSWRALAGMSQAEALTHTRADDLLAIQAGLGQWTADLDALADTGHTPALDFDGRTLRLTRRDALEGDHHSPGVQVVAWSLQQGQWRRWQVAGLRSRQAVSLAWEQAARWGQRPVDEDQRQQVDLARAEGWQVFYYRGEAWTNPLSADSAALPDGVRLVLNLSPGQTLSGELILDWAKPVLGGGKS